MKEHENSVSPVLPGEEGRGRERRGEEGERREGKSF
jgi:hypothetical protein